MLLLRRNYDCTLFLKIWGPILHSQECRAAQHTTHQYNVSVHGKKAIVYSCIIVNEVHHLLRYSCYYSWVYRTKRETKIVIEAFGYYGIVPNPTKALRCCALRTESTEQHSLGSLFIFCERTRMSQKWIAVRSKYQEWWLVEVYVNENEGHMYSIKIWQYSVYCSTWQIQTFPRNTVLVWKAHVKRSRNFEINGLTVNCEVNWRLTITMLHFIDVPI